MDVRLLARIDLNLLVALHVLLEERSVSRAAERLHITQPAMSKTLGRLRDTFDDPLFIRSAHGVKPTPRSLELEPELRVVLGALDALVSPSTFDPAVYRGEFTIAATETIGVVVLAPLMEKLAAEAPGIRIRTITRVENQLEQLAEGNLDFSIHMRNASYSDDYDLDCLARSRPVALVRREHPIVGQAIDWAGLVTYPFVEFYIPDLEDIALFQRQLSETSRSAAPEFPFETSHLMTALDVVRRTDCVLILPSFATLNPMLRSSIAILPLPLPLDDDSAVLEYLLVAHRRVQRSAPHQWLRQRILELAQPLEPRGKDAAG